MPLYILLALDNALPVVLEVAMLFRNTDELIVVKDDMKDVKMKIQVKIKNNGSRKMLEVALTVVRV